MSPRFHSLLFHPWPLDRSLGKCVASPSWTSGAGRIRLFVWSGSESAMVGAKPCAPRAKVPCYQGRLPKRGGPQRPAVIPSSRLSHLVRWKSQAADAIRCPVTPRTDNPNGPTPSGLAQARRSSSRSTPARTLSPSKIRSRRSRSPLMDPKAFRILVLIAISP